MSLTVWCAVLLLGGATSAPAPAAISPASLESLSLEPPAPDEETLKYLLPQLLSARYSAGGGAYAGGAWRGLPDPSLYVLAELPHHYQSYESLRQKRKMPSLSISNPMEVLRQRLVLEIARKQMREHAQRQAEENRLFLQNVGKRGVWGAGMLDASRDDN